jgi:ABC-type transport system substrate-binding protein
MVPISRRSMLAGASVLPFAPRIARAASPSGTLTFGLSSFPPNLQPFASTGTAALTVKALLFRGLLSFGPDGNVRGELAESWERDGDQGWVFHLREASFQNGAPVTAEDVKWTFEQIAAEKSGAYLRGQFADLASIETPDARTVRLVTKSPIVTLPLTLATPFAPIIAKDTLATPVGAGPYTLAARE